MTVPIQPLFLSAMLAAAASAEGLAQEPTATRDFLIGNSPTWDTVPPRLSGDVQWHVDCGVNLPFIHAQVTDAGLPALATWKSLKKRSLGGLKNITSAGIEQLRKARPELVIQAQ